MPRELDVMYKKFYVLIFLVLFCNQLHSQTHITGFVYDKENHTPLQNVNLIDKKSGRWSTTDEKGAFSIVLNTDFELVFTLLGKEDFTLTSKHYTPKMTIYLSEKTLRLSDVVVTATQEKDKVNSSVVLTKYAISQFQSFSLSDVLQQLPGQVISKPSLYTPNTLTLRTAINSNENAFGISYILDDMPLSNDENMQTYNGSTPATSFSNVNTGIDLRTIPTSSIEKVEVITGVPDAKYGNVTTGVIIIDRKAGVYPLQIAASMIGGGNSLSMNQGFKLNKNLGNLSLSIDYLNANSDPRNNLSSYNRITTSSIWSYHSKNNQIKNTLSFTFRSNIDGKKTDKEQLPGYRDSSNKKDIGTVISNRTAFQFENSWIDQLSLNAGVSYSVAEDYKETFVNRGGLVVPIATETNLLPGFYTPVAYKSKTHTQGEPLNINSSLSINKIFEYKNTKHSLSFGVSLNYSDNLGKGKIYDSDSALSSSTLFSTGNSKQGVRPLNFGRYVIASKLLSIYLQDNISLKINETQDLNTNIGFRYENLNGYVSVSPRINAMYKISPKMKFRWAIGLTSKSPSLVNIFPGNVYFDVLLFDIRTNDYVFNLVQTFVEKISKINLKPSKSWKYEIGADFDFSFAKLNLTAYLNRLYDGFGKETIYKLYALPVVKVIPAANTKEIPSYQITGYENIVRNYSKSVNAHNNTDKGLELMLHFKKIKAINTQFSLVGSYTFSESQSDLPEIYKNNDVLEQEYVYGFYQSRPSKREKMNLRLTASHHISSLGLLISLTAEQFIFEKDFSILKDIYPYAYQNLKLEYHTIPFEQRTDPKYLGLVLTQSKVEDRITPIYHNFHLRITKEMLSGLSMSVYATNFLNYRPKVTINNSTYYKNSDISFGGSIRYSF